MKVTIDIAWGKGKGNTATSAYDAALNDAGISNFNLLILSSIIPPGAVVREVGAFEGRGTGNVLPVVIAKTVGKGHQVAGIGWVNSPDGGLLVTGTGSDKDTVAGYIEQSLNDMIETRNWDFSDTSYRIVEADYALGCAIAAAVFVIPRLQFLEWFWTSPSTGGVHPEG